MFSREQKSHSNTRKHRSPRPCDLSGFLLHLTTHAQAFVHSELCRPQPACDLGQDCPSLGLRLPSSPCQPRRRVSGAWSMLSDLQGSLVPGCLWLVPREVTSACSPDSPSKGSWGPGSRVSHWPACWVHAPPAPSGKLEGVPSSPKMAGRQATGDPRASRQSLGWSQGPHLARIYTFRHVIQAQTWLFSPLVA